MTFIIGTFQSHCKIEYNQVRWNKITQDMSESDSIFSYSQSSTLFKWLLKFISWSGLSKKCVITVPKEKCTSFTFIP